MFAGKDGKVAHAGSFRHVALEAVDSTNSEAMRRARAGEGPGLWITAARQQDGRGRRGRNWASEPGNLYASLLLVDPAPRSQMSSLPLAVAVAVERAIARLMAGQMADIAIKWPNDILIDRKKVCGILLEAEPLSDGRLAVVIGIGVNVAYAPDHAAYAVTRISDYVAGADPEILFAYLFETMADELAIWDRGNGIATTVDRWRQNACGIGERILVNLPREQVRGRFAGIDETGMLIVETEEDGTRIFAAGDVFFEN